MCPKSKCIKDPTLNDEENMRYLRQGKDGSPLKDFPTLSLYLILTIEAKVTRLGDFLPIG
jgi:hypothetical protein